MSLKLRCLQALVLPFVLLAIALLSLGAWSSMVEGATQLARWRMLGWPESALAVYFVGCIVVACAITLGLAILLTRRYIAPIVRSKDSDQVLEALLQDFLGKESPPPETGTQATSGSPATQ